MARVGVVFVCLGNICRSPTAEAVFVDLLEREGLSSHFDVDSAGTGSWHVGEQADRRARAEARARGLEIGSIARQFTVEDFDQFEHVVVMDRSNFDDVVALARRDEDRAKVRLLRSFDPDAPAGAGVPDPYYEGGFDKVFDVCAAGARGLLRELRERHGL